jgi:hypothetical protein
MAAQRRRKKKSSKEVVKKIPYIKILPYFVAGFLFTFFIYRIVVLISFKVDCSKIPKETLSTNSAIVNTLFVVEQNEKIINIELISYSKDQQKILRLDIPANIYVLEEGIESFPISSMQSVGEFLEHNSGKKYTIDYLSRLLGLKFDNYVWIVDSSDTTEEFLSKLSVWSILFDFKYSHELEGSVYSNLPILNLIKETNFINQTLSRYQYEKMDILDCCVEEVVISSDRKELQFSKIAFDSEFSKYIQELVSREVERERVNVEVYNASNISGLASEYARKVRHTGCRILRYDNAPNLYDNTVIYVPEPEGYQNSLMLIKDVLGKDVEIRYERPSFVTTGDIVLILGKDIAD